MTRLIWGLMSHQQLRSHGDGTLVIWSHPKKTGEAQDRTRNPWFTWRVILPTAMEDSMKPVSVFYGHKGRTDVETRDVNRSPNVRTSDPVPKFGSKF